ncbi:MAG: class I SAM-dependent methyltransferase [Dehalococcoidales bacterium]|nr:class I SAM-dependent methyltransferase [Dehalococcoidales bacterium]
MQDKGIESGMIRKSLYHKLNPILVKLYKVMCRFRPFEMVLDFTAWKLFRNTGIPFLESIHSTGSAELDWDTRAKVDGLITATGQANEEKAGASAIKAVENRILRGLQVDRHFVVLEIGCGIGNLLKPMASQVGEAHGVDISGEMLRLAAERLKGYSNIFLHKTDGSLAMFTDDYFDIVFSSGVFIHFPSKPMVYEYFKEAARVLKPGGIFRFNMDGRNYLRWRRKEGGTLRGVVFDSAEIRENLEKCGFRVQDMSGMNSLDMWATAVLPK